METRIKTLLRTALIGLVSVMAPTVLFADTIDPVTYTDTIGVGESVTIDKTVVIEAAGTSTAIMDVMFLMDTTGSMGNTIAGAKSAASTILSNLAGFGDLQSGVAAFDDPVPTNTIVTALTANDAAVQAGLNSLSAGGGGDYPERGLQGLTIVANDTSWRPGSNRFIVMFGDASEKVPSLEASTLAVLQAENITLIGIDVSTCPGCFGLTFTQAYDALAEATGGDVFSSGTSGSALTTTIQNAVTSTFATYSNVCLDASGAPTGVSVSTSGCHSGSFDRSVDNTFNFTVTFTGDDAGVYDFPIHATVDGGIVATELDSITVAVPEPGITMLLGMGLLGLAIRRRRFAA